MARSPTIVASNAGPSTATGATVTDNFPAALTGATWTCTASAGSSCPASGSGNISASVTLLSGGTATFTV
ncbi:MAG: IPTL-CTERM sorting domain-containing protein, partial [Gemmatimonadetes bacterium]|nr:IPTL-CTERM sorting domain-containing protein [Gemmatimonadota bacterium]